MWFDFQTDTNTGFWMKEMNFSIDMLFLNKDLKIMHIKENATPESYPESFGPSTPYRYVLEVQQILPKNILFSSEILFCYKKEN